MNSKNENNDETSENRNHNEFLGKIPENVLNYFDNQESILLNLLLSIKSDKTKTVAFNAEAQNILNDNFQFQHLAERLISLSKNKSEIYNLVNKQFRDEIIMALYVQYTMYKHEGKLSLLSQEYVSLFENGDSNENQDHSIRKNFPSLKVLLGVELLMLSFDSFDCFKEKYPTIVEAVNTQRSI